MSSSELWRVLTDLSATVDEAGNRLHEAERRLYHCQQMIRDLALRLGAQPPDVLDDQ